MCYSRNAGDAEPKVILSFHQLCAYGGVGLVDLWYHRVERQQYTHNVYFLWKNILCISRSQTCTCVSRHQTLTSCLKCFLVRRNPRFYLEPRLNFLKFLEATDVQTKIQFAIIYIRLFFHTPYYVFQVMTEFTIILPQLCTYFS